MRKRRAALPAQERQAEADALTQKLSGWAPYQDSRRIAAYSAVGGELDVTPILAHALRHGRHIYLPAVVGTASRQLEFRPWHTDTPMEKSHYGIPQPVAHDAPPVAPEALDLVLVPLTAVDTSGNRLGQGAGYYDSTFAFLRDDNRARPVLAGMAYDFQIVDAIDPKPWDVPLDFIVTPAAIIECG